MKKNTPLFFFLFLFPVKQYAQLCDTTSFQNIYFNKNVHDAHPKNIFFEEGDMYITGYTESAINKSSDAWIMKMTLHGTPLWSRAIGTAASEIIGGIRRTTDGGFMIAGSTRDAAQYEEGWIAKLDANCIPQWSVALRGAYGRLAQISELRDGSYAAVGSLFLRFTTDHSGNVISVQKGTNLILRLDKNGNILWWKSFHNTENETLNNVAQLKDGSLIACGNVVNELQAYIIKFNLENGNTIWMNGYENTISSNSAHVGEMDDGSIHLSTSNKTYYFTVDGKSMGGSRIDLRANGIVLQDPSVSSIDTDSSQNKIYFTNLSPRPVLFDVKNDSVTIWAHVFNEKDNGNSLKLRTAKVNNGSIFLIGSYITDNISDAARDEDLTYIIKSDMNGNTLCASPFKIDLSNSDFPPKTNATFNWKYEGAIQSQFIHPYIESLEPMKTGDCSPQSCCKNELIYTYDTICEGSSYLLPDSRIITTPGIYASQYSTAAGCDSIIYTYLSVKKPYAFGFSLGNDTCLINEAPLSFSLPVDSSVHYHWQDGSTSATYTANLPGTYWVTAYTDCNSFTDSIRIFANCTLPVYIPSGFTPNKDGLNDIFRIINMNGQHLLNFNIYNRYGQLIFATNDPSIGWNGTFKNIPQASGTYVYFIKYADLEKKLHMLKGTVVLIR